MRTLFVTILFVVSTAVFPQAKIEDLGFNYSALVRDAAGRVQPLADVKLRFTLLLGQNGTSVNSPWSETQEVKTDAYGFVNVTIGKGKKETGTAASFADVDFSTFNYWIVIEVWNKSTNAYDPLAKQAFQAVPYAKVAGSVAGSGGLPPGTVVAFAGESVKVPNGWLLCDGRELDNTDTKYINLFKSIGYSWGTTNSANKFNIPDTRGLFLRGVSSSSENDPDSDLREASKTGGNAGNKVGSKQVDELKSHAHVFSAVSDYSGNQGSPNFGGGPFIHIGKTTNPSGGNETRPKNIYVNYIIKL